MDVTVVIASYGDNKWRQLTLDRARPSVEEQTEHIVTVHGGSTLAAARNAGLERVKTEWVCFLDADDELEPGYFDAMTKGVADLRAPSVRYVAMQSHPRANKVMMPKVVGPTHSKHQCTGDCLMDGNWMVIGTVARTVLVQDAGGFDEYPVYEDYALFAKLWVRGASVEAIPQAVYRAHVRKDSRNRGSMTPPQKHAVHQQIARDVGLRVPA